MTTICITKKDTNEIIACIPLCDGNGVLHKDYDIKVYNGTEPYFNDADDKVILSDNVFGIRI